MEESEKVGRKREGGEDGWHKGGRDSRKEEVE